MSNIFTKSTVNHTRSVNEHLEHLERERNRRRETFRYQKIKGFKVETKGEIRWRSNNLVGDIKNFESDSTALDIFEAFANYGFIQTIIDYYKNQGESDIGEKWPNQILLMRIRALKILEF